MPIILHPGDSIYKYKLQGVIGGGAFGQVWLARDTTIDRDVAIKVIEASVATLSEKLREAQIGNQLNHPNLVKVHYADVVGVGGVPTVIISMDYHSDGSVLGRLSAGNFMPLPQAIACTIDVLRGLEFLHSLGMYHGDIKPKNILCGSNSSSVLTDYGITCHSATGTPAPMRDAYRFHIAPATLLTSNIDERTDLHQVGMTAFRLLNGIGIVEEKYHRLGETTYFEEVKKGTLIRPNDYAPFIPRQVKTIINKAIDPNPRRQFQSAREFRRALEGLLFPGQWTMDGTGALLGRTEGNEFRFEEHSHTMSKFEIVAFRRNVASGRETRVSAHCATGLTKTGLAKAKQAFIQAVVKGEC
jgi:eukaryotic-like serine/threonine-protein kinase